jgi:hypothetical protein
MMLQAAKVRGWRLDQCSKIEKVIVWFSKDSIIATNEFQVKVDQCFEFDLEGNLSLKMKNQVL